MNTHTEEFIKMFQKIRSLKMRDSSKAPFRHAEFFMIGTIMDCVEAKKSKGETEWRVTVSELSKCMGITSAAVSKMLRGMEGRGLIVREVSESDRRNVYICLSDHGKELLDRHFGRLEKIMDKVIEKVGDEDANCLLELFEKYYGAMKEVLKEEEDGLC